MRWEKVCGKLLEHAKQLSRWTCAIYAIEILNYTRNTDGGMHLFLKLMLYSLRTIRAHGESGSIISSIRSWNSFFMYVSISFSTFSLDTPSSNDFL